jgi:uncharacterized protein
MTNSPPHNRVAKERGMQLQSMQAVKDLDWDGLREVFQGYPEVQAVYLFGSHATGRLHLESDVDLGLVPAIPGGRKLKLDILTDLTRSGFCEVSLVFLDTADVVLKYEVVRHNRLIYSTKDFDRGAYYSKVVREYLDFEPYLEVQREAYKRRILHGAAGSSS